jgi:PBP1b-binding outer membrane lipoprotein LpoB
MKTSIKFIVLITITLFIFSSCTQQDTYEIYETEQNASDNTKNDTPTDPDTSEDEPELEPNA